MARSLSVEIDRLVVDRPMSRRAREELAAAVSAEFGRLLRGDIRRSSRAGGLTGQLVRDLASAIRDALPAHVLRATHVSPHLTSGAALAPAAPVSRSGSGGRR